MTYIAISKRLTVLTAAALLAAGCNQHGEPAPDPPGKNSIKVQFTMPVGVATTRAVAAEPGENNINDLTLLFFSYSTNGTGKYEGFYRVPAEDIPAEAEMYGEQKNHFDIEVLFSNSSRLSVDDAYSILVLANMDKNLFSDMDAEFDGFIDQALKMDENDVIRSLVMFVSGVGSSVEAQTDNSKTMQITNLPMSCRFVKEEKATVLGCKLERAVVRYDVINKTNGYRLVSASIWNAFPRGYVFDNVNVDYSYPRTKRYYGVRDENGLDNVYGGLYSFENVSTEPSRKDDRTTCLIIGMSPEADPTDISYYRVNINPKVTEQYLLRNNVYQVTVSGVNGPGAGNEPDAYASDDVQLDTSINSWDRDEDGLIVRNDTHMMALPTKRAVFGPEGDYREYFIYTMGEGTLEMSVMSMPEGMEARLAGNFVHLTVAPYGGDKRTGAIKFSFAGLTAIMELVQNGETGKYLNLSHTHVPSWPASSIGINMLEDRPVIVNSSGPWTAEIYNGYFSFRQGSDEIIRKGTDGDQIAAIYNTAVAQEIRHSFALITLDEDEENYRNVIVLTQLGAGSFSITPSDNGISFKADGSLLSDHDTFTVHPGSDNDKWFAKIEGNHADAFTVSYDKQPVDGTIEGKGSFTVSSPGDNFDGELSATLVITHNSINEKRLSLYKESYHFGLSQTALSLPSKGGETVAVTVNCTNRSSTWSAEITGNIDGIQPYIIGPDGQKVTSLSTQPVETSFKVWMPGIDRQLDTPPVATVKVTLDGWQKEALLTVTQQGVEYSRIYAQTIHDDYGNWASTNTGSSAYKTFRKWMEEMTDPANFGPSGKVYSPYTVDVSRQNRKEIITTGGTPLIFNLNGIRSDCTIQSADFSPYRQDEHVVFIAYGWETSHMSLLRPGFSDYTVGKGNNRAQYMPRTVYTGNPAVTQTALWDYIFYSGPFGPVDPAGVSLHPQYYYSIYTYLTSWPETFIPLIMNPDSDGTQNFSQVLVGVDPTNRLIWIGHKDLFGIDDLKDLPNWQNGDNLNFMRNLIAWMINVNNFGDGFNDRFKETVPRN